MSKSNLEWNKVSAAILLGGLLTMIIGLIADALYVPAKNPERGFQVAVVEGEEIASAVVAEPEPVNVAALLRAASAAGGKKVAKKCVSCHSFDNGGKHKTGPKLWRISGAKQARFGDYKYSKAFKGLNGRWTNQELFDFLTKPSKYVKGTKMSFAGIKKPNQTADLVAYLNSLK